MLFLSLLRFLCIIISHFDSEVKLYFHLISIRLLGRTNDPSGWVPSLHPRLHKTPTCVVLCDPLFSVVFRGLTRVYRRSVITLFCTLVGTINITRHQRPPRPPTEVTHRISTACPQSYTQGYPSVSTGYTKLSTGCPQSYTQGQP